MPLDPKRKRSITTYLNNPSAVLSETDLDRIARLYYDSSPNLWASVTSDGSIKHVNPTWERMTGYSLVESRQMHFQDFFSEDAGRAAQILDGLKWEHFRGGQRLNLILKSGATLIVGVRGERFNGAGLAHLRLIDMTIRAAMDERLRLASQQLERQGALFKAIVENCPMMITINERDGTYRYVSPACKLVLLVEPDVLVGKNAFSLIHPGDIHTVQSVFERMLRQPGRADKMSVRFAFDRALRDWKPDAVLGDRDYILIESTGINLLNVPNLMGFITYTQAWQRIETGALPPVGGGVRNGEKRFSKKWDRGDDYEDDGETL